MKTYSVKQMAKLANISSRTLRHYDEIGLLKPAFVNDNGYRFYQHDQLTKLIQILFYKELDFSLEEIKRITNNPSYELPKSLEDHKQLLNLKIKRYKRLIKTINQILDGYTGTKTMRDNQPIQSFGQEEINKYKDEVKARWGHTEAYRQSMERYKKWTKSDLEKIKREGISITKDLADVMGKNIADDQVQKLINKHHQHINQFYECSLEMYRVLGEMYFADPRFSKYYQDIKPGLAEFMNQAISYYCDNHST